MEKQTASHLGSGFFIGYCQYPYPAIIDKHGYFINF